MIVHAELNCLTCGYEMGDIEGERGAPVEELVFLAVHQGDTLTTDPGGHIRCPRCRSRVIPQGVVPVRRPLNPNMIHEGDLTKEVRRRVAS